MADAAEAFYAHLDRLTLDDLICENVALADILRPLPCAKRA